MASVKRRPDGKWRARYRDPAGRERARHFARKVDAEHFLAGVTVDTLTGRYVDPKAGRQTVGDYVAGWAEARPWRASTRASREAVIDTQILPTFGAVPLASVRRSDVQGWVGRMTAADLAASSVEAYYRVFAQMMRSAVRDRLLAESPCSDVTMPTAHGAHAALVPLTSEQVDRLAAEVPRRYRALVLVSAALGLRQGEACALTVDRVDFLRRRVTVDRQVVTPAKGSVCDFGPPKTPSSTRVIPLPESVAEVLAAHIAEFTPHGEPTRLLFTTRDGAMLARTTWHGAFSAAAARIGVKASTHDLRHHAASLLISAGCSPRAVASFLGHKHAAETLNTYAHLWPSDEGRITAAIDAGLRANADYSRTRAVSGD